MDFSSALLPLPWTVVHAMDERSPLFGATQDSLVASDAEIIAVLDGTDEVQTDTWAAIKNSTHAFYVSRAVPSRSRQGGHIPIEVRKHGRPI